MTEPTEDAAASPRIDEEGCIDNEGHKKREPAGQASSLYRRRRSFTYS
jgi:hypothetical protein